MNKEQQLKPVIDLTKIADITANGRMIPRESANTVIDYLFPFWQQSEDEKERESIVILSVMFCPILMEERLSKSAVEYIYKERATFVMEMSNWKFGKP